jgi:PKD repeat protein
MIYSETLCRVDKPTGSGPYSTDYIFTYIPRINLTPIPSRVYYPTSGGGVDSNGAPYTGIVFAPGASGTETSYYSTLSQIASWGFIITIVGTGGPVNQEVADIQSYVLDFYSEQNSNSSSIFFNNIDQTGFGASGHSNGGWAAIAGGVADTRFQAICPLAAAAGPYYGSGQANTGNLYVPLQLVAGAEDHTFLPSSDAYYSVGNPIKSYLKITGSGHGGPFNLEYLVSFFKFWLDDEDEYGTFIYGDELQKDIDANVLEFSSDVGITPNPMVSDSNVYEDELIDFTLDAIIVYPNPPDRTIIKYQWDFDSDGIYDWEASEPAATSYSFQEEDNYYVRYKITDSWGLSASSSYVVEVNNKKPLADAGSRISANEDETIYLDGGNSTDTPSDISTLQFQWDFGDGNQTEWDYLAKTTYSFPQMGEYSIRLRVKDDDGDIDLDLVKVVINNVAPNAEFSIEESTVKIGETVYFYANRSIDTPSDIGSLKYYWDFGDSDEAEGIITTHRYNDEGNYEVRLDVEDDDGEQDFFELTVVVQNRPPSCIAMEDVSAYEDETIYFSGEGFDTKHDQDNLEYSWYLGIPNIPHSSWNDTPEYEWQYTEAGEYTAVLTVRDDDGDTASDEVKININNVKPTAKFSTSSAQILEDGSIILDASISTDTPSDIDKLNFTWQLDHGTDTLYKYGRVQVLTLIKAGQYELKLTVTDDDGEIDWITKKIKVRNVNPTAKILVSGKNYTANTPVTFSALESYDTDSDQEYLNFSWDFGDETETWGSVVTHIYSDPGVYQVTLLVTDNDGAVGTEDIKIKIEEGESKRVTEPESKSDEDSSWILPMIVFNVVLIVVLIGILLFYLKRSKENFQEK